MTRETLRAGPLSLEIETEGAVLRSVKLPAQVPAGLDAATLRQALAALGRYEIDFSRSSPFFRNAWERMRDIGWGEVLSYKDLARLAGSPRAVRAAGQACARNPCVLIVPCHRVLAEGGIGGFGYGLEWKRKLLELEGRDV